MKNNQSKSRVSFPIKLQWIGTESGWIEAQIKSRKAHSNTTQIGPSFPTQMDHKGIPKTRPERPHKEAVEQGRNWTATGLKKRTDRGGDHKEAGDKGNHEAKAKEEKGAAKYQE